MPEEHETLQQSNEALQKKNSQLIGELRAAKAQRVPEGVNVEELLEFKRKAEQAELEAKGQYTQALQAREQQFRDATAERDKRIAELEARTRELEILSPAKSALAEVVHDPDVVLQTKLKVEQIEREADGSVVVVNGYERTPVREWARRLPDWMQKAPRAQGSGAPTGRSNAAQLPPNAKNPFSKEAFNLTEQHRLFNTDPDFARRLRDAAR